MTYSQKKRFNPNNRYTKTRTDDKILKSIALKQPRFHFLRNLEKLGGLDGMSLDFGVCWMCYSSDSQILTEIGWKYFYELTSLDKVATLNPKGFLEWNYPEIIFSKKYSGYMYHLNSASIDLLVTKEHLQYVRLRDKKSFELKPSQEVIGKRMELKTDANWEGEEIKKIRIGSKEYEMTLLIPLIGLFISEGSCGKINNQVKIAQVIHKKEVENVLLKLKLKFGYANDSFYFTDQSLHSFLLQFGRNAKEKHIPIFFKNLARIQLENLLDFLMLGDGNFTKTEGRKGNRVYTTSSWKLADDIQEILLKTGSSGRIATVKEHFSNFKNGKYLCSQHYRVLERKTWLTPEVNGKKRKDDQMVWYKNTTVWDINVPNHIIYIRRNGKPCWSSNCWVRITGEGLNSWRKEPFSENRTHTSICPLCIQEKWSGRVWYPKRFVIYTEIGNPSRRDNISPEMRSI
jgi:replicative DNA helicase Mcm